MIHKFSDYDNTEKLNLVLNCRKISIYYYIGNNPDLGTKTA